MMQEWHYNRKKFNKYGITQQTSNTANDHLSKTFKTDSR